MKPYYEQDGITIYHGDCREIDAWLAADVLVTDPPYGMSYVTGKRSHDDPLAAPIAGDDSTDLRTFVLDAWGDRPALIFGTWRVVRPTGTRQLLVWDKGDSPGMGDLALPWGPAHEEVYVLGDGWQGKRRANVIRRNTLGSQSADRPDHPTPKPVSLMIDLLSYSPLGVIADPFMGSGSTLRAAADIGRKAIGIEIEERHCEIAAKRLAQGVFDFSAPAPPVADERTTE